MDCGESGGSDNPSVDPIAELAGGENAEGQAYDDALRIRASALGEGQQLRLRKALPFCLKRLAR